MASDSRKRASETADDSHLTKKSKINASRSNAIKNTAIRKEDLNGDSSWEISKLRRVTISSFRGKTLVGIREFYEKDGEELPGKKVHLYLISHCDLKTVRGC